MIEVSFPNVYTDWSVIHSINKIKAQNKTKIYEKNEFFSYKSLISNKSNLKFFKYKWNSWSNTNELSIDDYSTYENK